MKSFDCRICDAPLQTLRNCSGRGRPATIILANEIQPRCPRATYLESTEERYLVNAYMFCDRSHDYPAPGGYLAQASYTIELFDYLVGVIAEARARHAKEQEKAQKS